MAIHVGLSFTLIYACTRFFHLAHGAIMVGSAYCAYAFISIVGNLNEEVAPWSCVFIYLGAVLIAGSTGAVSGYLVNRLVYSRLRVKRATNLILLVASVGVLVFVEHALALVFGNQVQSLRLGSPREGYGVFGAMVTPIQITLITSTLVSCSVLWILSSKTRFGWAMRAVADDPVTSSVVGINPERIIHWVFVIGSGIAGASAVLIALETQLHPSMGFPLLLKGVVASIIGGIGRFWGVVLGALVVGMIEQVSLRYLSAGWEEAVLFGVLVIFLIVMPRGILGRLNQERAD